MGKGEQEIEQGDNARLCGAVFDHARGAVKDADQLRGKNIVEDADGFRHQHSGKDRKARPLFGAVIHACAEILADKGGGRHVKAGDGQENKAFDLGVDAVARHGEFSEGIDLGLDDNIGKGDNRILHAGRKPVAEDLGQDCFMKADTAYFHSIDIALAQQVYHAESHTGGLGYDGGGGSSPDTLMETADKQQIQYNIYKRRKDQIVQRPFAVSEGVHNAAAYIVHNHGDGAEKIVAEIFDGFRHDFRVCSHPDQKSGRKQNADDRKEHAADKPESDHRMYGTGNLPLIPCTEISGDNHTAAHRKPHKEADQKKDQIPGGGNGGEGVGSQIFSHDKGVCRIV